MNSQTELPIVPPVKNFISTLSSSLEALLEKDRWSFSLQGKVCSPEELTASDALLSVWMHRGTCLMKEAFETEPPMLYMDNPESCCGVVPLVSSEGTAPLPIWICFIHAAIEDWRNQPQYAHLLEAKEPIPMDDLWNEFMYVSENRLIPRISPPKPVVEMSNILNRLLGENQN